MIGSITGPVHADYWSPSYWSSGSSNPLSPASTLALSDENAVEYQSLAQPFVVTTPDVLNALVFFGGCMGSPAGGCILTNRVLVRIRSASNGQPGPVLYQTTQLVQAVRTGRQFFPGASGIDPEEQARDMTTDEIEYQVDLGHTPVSPGTYFLEMSGNVSPVYAWAWEIDRRADASALALRNQHGVWTNESIVARYGVLTGGEIGWGYPPEQVTMLYRIVSDQPPHSFRRWQPQFSRLWQHH
ncbi:hypothetical protein PQR33_36205 [Paraburkholderia sediminicola]|uniref:hypothetical protein n=1 Tax=Paraburkholderia sediminicola TaxID=458836 RepID=UPI0038BCFECD